jgi:hypothetical protein
MNPSDAPSSRLKFGGDCPAAIWCRLRKLLSGKGDAEDGSDATPVRTEVPISRSNLAVAEPDLALFRWDSKDERFRVFAREAEP